MYFFYQNIDYIVQTNNLQLTEILKNNMIKLSQTINILPYNLCNKDLRIK